MTKIETFQDHMHRSFYLFWKCWQPLLLDKWQVGITMKRCLCCCFKNELCQSPQLSEKTDPPLQSSRWRGVCAERGDGPHCWFFWEWKVAQMGTCPSSLFTIKDSWFLNCHCEFARNILTHGISRLQKVLLGDGVTYPFITCIINAFGAINQGYNYPVPPIKADQHVDCSLHHLFLWLFQSVGMYGGNSIFCKGIPCTFLATLVGYWQWRTQTPLAFDPIV